MITILTPTFNRAYILTNAYTSLQKQTNQCFEWLIVDDGSVDNTKELIDMWIREDIIKIRYIFQENQGKHIAINKGVQNAINHYFMILDSDDILLPTCIDEVLQNLDSVKDDTSVAGTTFFIATEEYAGKEDAEYKRIVSYEKDFIFRTKFKREAVFCLKTEVWKEFPYPKFPREKFCPESLILSRITRKYKLLFYTKVLAEGEYRQDGLTAKYWQLLLNNPRGSMLNFAEKLKYAGDENKKVQFAKNYWNVALKAKKISWFEKLRGIPLKYSLKILFKKLI